MNPTTFLRKHNSVKINKKINHAGGNLDLSGSGDTIRGHELSWAENRMWRKVNWKNSVQVNSRTELRADSKSELRISLWFKPVKLLTCFGVGYRSPKWQVRLLHLSHEVYSQLRWTHILLWSTHQGLSNETITKSFRVISAELWAVKL